jgi:hypothetical protein
VESGLEQLAPVVRTAPLAASDRHCVIANHPVYKTTHVPGCLAMTQSERRARGRRAGARAALRAALGAAAGPAAQVAADVAYMRAALCRCSIYARCAVPL